MKHFQSDCGCGKKQEEPDVQQQIALLSQRIRNLTEMLVEHMQDDPSDPVARNRANERAKAAKRIIGGDPVRSGEFPECCLIGNTSAGGFLREWFCTGSLIHPRVVITAAHCISRTAGRINPNSIGIGIDDEREVQTDNIIRVARILRHPTEDVALLLLQKASPIEPIRRATAEEIASAGRVHLVGFGNDDPAGSVGFGIKREVNVRMQVVRKNSNEDLSPAEATLGFNSFTEFVAGRKGSGKDSCNGDSGGPAYVSVNGTRKLAGATSRATDEANNNCGNGGVYVRVDVVSDWIDDAIASLG